MLHLVFVLSQEICGFSSFAYTTKLISQLPVKGLYSCLWNTKDVFGKYKLYLFLVVYFWQSNISGCIVLKGMVFSK